MQGQALTLQIDRHTVQSILHHALAASPSPCCGLLGNHLDASDPSNITAARTLPDSGQSLRQAAQDWCRQGFSICGLYHTPNISSDSIKALATTLFELCNKTALIDIAVEMATDGRMDANAFWLDAAGNRQSVALLMQE